jgi:osmotically-inducible protein OsmY
MHKPDKLLEAAVREELLWDPHLDDRRVVVRAHNGRVTLSGWVPSYEQETVAVDDTWAKGGVRDVDDELLVGAAGEPAVDDELAEVCRLALRAERLVPDRAVKVSVTAGQATLSGVRAMLSSDPLLDDGRVLVKVRNGLVGLSGAVGSSEESGSAIASGKLTVAGRTEPVG